MDPGPEQRYFPDMAKSLFIADNPEEKEVARLEFNQAGLHLNYVDGSIYLKSCLGPMEELGMGASRVRGMGPRVPHPR